MSFTYSRMTEEEAIKAREFPLLEKGVYNFTVMESKFKRSQAGNPMIELKLRITHDGKEFNVFDNLISMPSMEWKTIHFCRVTGLEIEYDNQQFNERLAAGKRGKCMISRIEAKPKNDGSGEFYKAKNVVDDYVSTDTIAPSKTEGQGAEFFNDSIPF